MYPITIAGSVIMPKLCKWGDCKSDSRRPKVEGLRFLPFPKPQKNRERAMRWMFLCARVGLTLDKIKSHMYVCSLHFPPGSDLNLRYGEVPIIPTVIQ